MKKITVKITGAVPVLFHADVLADPLNPATIAHKEISSKRKKTDADHLALAESEWRSSFYFDDDGKVTIPTAILKACLVNGAKLNKLGSTVKRAVLPTGSFCEFQSDADGNLAKMWESRKYVDARTVKVGTSKIVRYRPKFSKWSATASFIYDEEQISLSEIKQCFENAGNFVGVGDFRPTFGLFTCEFIGESK